MANSQTPSESDDSRGEHQPASGSDTDRPTDPSPWPLYASVALVAVLVGSYFLFPDFQSFADRAYEVLLSEDEARIKAFVAELGWWGPVGVVLAMVVQMFLLVIPSPLLMVVSVLAYGPFWGAALSVVAVLIASSFGYFIGRYIGSAFIDRLVGRKKEKKIEYYVERYGLWAVVITRLAPMLSNDAISFVAGILRLGYRKFILATFLGITPLAALIGWFGENNDRLKSGLIWTSAISLVLFAAYVIYDRRQNPYSSANDKTED